MIHDRRHEEWLAELATGGVDPESEDSRRHLASCPACADGWLELRETQAALDDALIGERELLTAVRAAAPAPGEDRALATFRAVLLAGTETVAVPAAAPALHSRAGRSPAVHAPADGSPSGSRLPSSRAGLRWALVAAGLVFAFSIGWALHARTARPAPRVDVPLSASNDVPLLEPRGEVREYGTFRIGRRLGLGEVAKFYVSYVDEHGVLAVDTYTVESGDSWTPDASLVKRWPNELSWGVEITNTAQQRLAHSDADVRVVLKR